MIDLEEKLSEYLDNLLVQDDVLKPRKYVQTGSSDRDFGMMVSVLQKTRVKIKIEIYPNETEEPHFKVTYQGVSCRFKIVNCEPMKAETKNGVPPQIKKIMKQIKQMWQDNKQDLIQKWVESRPTSQHHGHQKIK